MRKIGGFFALEMPQAEAAHSVLALWQGHYPAAAFLGNSRSAFHWLILQVCPKTIWLPAYCCTALAQAVPKNVKLAFFPITPQLSPETDYLKKHVRPNDLVLAIDYFGKNPEPDFLSLKESLPGVTWVEDRAQAMHPSEQSWGDFILYSPRKLLGVPDGGLLISTKTPLPPRKQEWKNSIDASVPALMRYEDKEERYNEKWYAASRDYENQMGVSANKMYRLTYDILRATPVAPLMHARKANYAVLHELLDDIALFNYNNSFVPFGFPIKIPNRAALAKTLHGLGIFAAHHWPELPSSVSEFPEAHALCHHMLTLPVDHRYGIEDMQKIAQCVRGAL